MFHGFCLYYNRLENHSQWDKFTRFRSFLCAFFTVDIVVYNILFAIKYKISRKCNIHPNSMPKSINPFKMVTTSFCSCNKFLCTENARFSGSFAQNVHFREKPGIFSFSLFFVFAAVAGGGDSQRLFEDLCKIIHVQNAHFLGHGGNGVVVLHQQLGARLTRWVLI